MLPLIRHPSAGSEPGDPRVANAGAATLAGADGGGGGCGGRASLESPEPRQCTKDDSVFLQLNQPVKQSQGASPFVSALHLQTLLFKAVHRSTPPAAMHLPPAIHAAPQEPCSAHLAVHSAPTGALVCHVQTLVAGPPHPGWARSAAPHLVGRYPAMLKPYSVKIQFQRHARASRVGTVSGGTVSRQLILPCSRPGLPCTNPGGRPRAPRVGTVSGGAASRRSILRSRRHCAGSSNSPTQMPRRAACAPSSAAT